MSFRTRGAVERNPEVVFGLLCVYGSTDIGNGGTDNCCDPRLTYFLCCLLGSERVTEHLDWNPSDAHETKLLQVDPVGLPEVLAARLECTLLDLLTASDFLRGLYGDADGAHDLRLDDFCQVLCPEDCVVEVGRRVDDAPGGPHLCDVLLLRLLVLGEYGGTVSDVVE